MNYPTKIALICLSLILPAHLAAIDIPMQDLVVGNSQTIEVPYEIGDVAITKQSVCDFFVKENRRAIYLNPKAMGMTVLTIWDAKGKRQNVVPIRVLDASMGELKENFDHIFRDAGDVRIIQEGGELSVQGEVTLPKDKRRIERFASNYQELQTDVHLSDQSLALIANEMMRSMAIPTITARAIRHNLVLEGVVYNKSDMERLTAISKLYDIEVINLVELRELNRSPGKEKLVKLDFYFMEVKKEWLRKLGIHWAPGSFPTGGGDGGNGLLSEVGNIGGSLIGFVFNLLPKLTLARERNGARVLEHPSLVVKNGEHGAIFSGSQVPYYSNENVQFKDIGISVDVDPLIAADDVDMKLKISISSLSAGVKEGIDTHTVTTSAHCKSGQALALGGLIRNHDATTYNRIPSGVDTSSALFTLALSKEFQSSRSDFILFVVAHILDEPAPYDEGKIRWEELTEDIVKKRPKKERRAYKKRGVEFKVPELVKNLAKGDKT